MDGCYCQGSGFSHPPTDNGLTRAGVLTRVGSHPPTDNELTRAGVVTRVGSHPPIDSGLTRAGSQHGSRKAWFSRAM